eukprot:scaffold10796_cov114-Isochrysis_galbana.AAC.9
MATTRVPGSTSRGFAFHFFIRSDMMRSSRMVAIRESMPVHCDMPTGATELPLAIASTLWRSTRRQA